MPYRVVSGRVLPDGTAMGMLIRQLFSMVVWTTFRLDGRDIKE